MESMKPHRARRQARIRRDALARRRYRESLRNRIPVSREPETAESGNR